MAHLPSLSAGDAARLRKLIERGRYVPVMNDTKWAELIAAMRDNAGMRPEFRVRSLLGREGFVAEWDRDWNYHIHPVAEIQWVELRADSLEWLLAVLRGHHIPFTLDNGIPRVWGYADPDRQPRWA